MLFILEIMAFEFVSKCSKFNAHFTSAIKNPENAFHFRDNGVWICVKMSILQIATGILVISSQWINKQS